ncbi:amino acid adenylation domain-containing protein, partial [Bacillus atrophaeus]
RIKDIVSDADPYFIIHSFDEGSEKREAYADKNCIHLDDLLTDAKLCSDRNVCEIESSNQLAYVLYTSGSTGKSKGVMIEHIGMLNHMYSKIIDLKLSKKSVISQNASHCFDISVWQFFVSLLLGGTTVVISEEVILDLFDFFDELSRNQVTILEVVPSYLEPIIDFFSEEDPDYSIMNSIEAIIVTGEKFNKKLADNWFNIFPDIKMVNAYGPTEASDDITHHILYESPKEDFVTIGHAINNMNIYILDNDLKLCPIGVIGEICVAGIGVGRGYINMPEKTKEVFIKNPFEKRAVRLYRTGDYGKWMNQGNIEFVGRKDEQVKVRGFRIELGDVKNILLKHPEIDNIVVLCKENEMAEKKICAYIKSFRKIDRNELNSFFCQYAPRYMLPNEYKFIESFPLTSNGKIDVRALRTF